MHNIKKSPCFKIIKPLKVDIKRINTFLTEIDDMTINKKKLLKTIKIIIQ